MSQEGVKTDLEPVGGIGLLIRRVKQLEKDLNKLSSNKADIVTGVRELKERIKGFLHQIGADGAMGYSLEVEDIEGLVEILFLCVRSLRHDKECRQRDQFRLQDVVDALQRKMIIIEELQRRNRLQEMEIEMLKKELAKDARRRKRQE